MDIATIVVGGLSGAVFGTASGLYVAWRTGRSVRRRTAERQVSSAFAKLAVGMLDASDAAAEGEVLTSDSPPIEALRTRYRQLEDAWSDHFQDLTPRIAGLIDREDVDAALDTVKDVIRWREKPFDLVDTAPLNAHVKTIRWVTDAVDDQSRH